MAMLTHHSGVRVAIIHERIVPELELFESPFVRCYFSWKWEGTVQCFSTRLCDSHGLV